MRLTVPVPAVRALLAAALVAGCSETPFGPWERISLQQAEQRWKQNRPQNYSIEFKQSCFCGYVLPEYTRLEIRGDTVVAAHSLTPGVPDPPVPGWPTVDVMFGWLNDLAGEEFDYVTDVRVRYNSAYGYPTEVHIGCSENVADCGAQYFARNLQPMP